MFMYQCCIIYCESLGKTKTYFFGAIIHIEMRAVRINKDTAIPIYIPGVDEVLSFETLK